MEKQRFYNNNFPKENYDGYLYNQAPAKKQPEKIKLNTKKKGVAIESLCELFFIFLRHILSC